MTKEQYLNYVMLTEPKEKWSALLYKYIVMNKIRNWKWGFDFIVKWSDDGTEVYAYMLANLGYIEDQWAREAMEKQTNVSHTVADWMVRDGHATKEWFLEKIINGDRHE